MADEENPHLKHRLDHHYLINSLKSVVEGLLATHSTDVWSTYGGLNRVTKEVEKILYHGLRSTQGKFGSQVDFWPFVHGLKRLNPIQSPSIDKIIRLAHTTQGIDKGHVWVEEGLREHNLTAQLQTLVHNREHLNQFYFDYSFLNTKEYFHSMCLCLQAVEQNKVTLLAELDVNLLSGRRKPDVKRSESMPVMRRGSSHHEALALAPRFASPRQESVLSLSDEHAIPVSVGSASPVEAKMLARDALRTVLRKSGSDSPTDSPETGFSFYDNQTEDPLSHVSMTEHKAESKESSSEDQTKGKLPSKSTLSSVKKSLTPDPIGTSEKTYSGRPDEIFSDSETLTEEKRNVVMRTSKGTKKGHKRSRSDMTWLNAITKPQRTMRKHSEDIVGAPEIDSEMYLGTDVNSPTSPEGYMGKPAQGQSLIHYLSTQDFHTCANLDKENAHFSISEALIAAIEQMKWNHIISPHQNRENEEEDSDEEIQELKQRIRIRKRERLKEKARGLPAFSDGVTDTATSHSTSPTFSSPIDSENSDSSDSSAIDDEQIELTMSENISETNLFLMKKDGMSLSLASLYSDGDIQDRNNKMLDRQGSVTTENGVSASNSLSAESVAISLLKKFSEKQLPKASDLIWLVPESDAPQKLLPMPDSYPIDPDDAEDMKTNRYQTFQTRLRGNMEWAPPRPQIIFNIHQRPNRKKTMEKQNYLCAGCGTRVEPGYISRFRYCEYLGKFFCQCCHSKSLSYIPGRILKKWDFQKYQVSNFAHDLLTKIYTEPLFNICDINPSLYKKVKSLDSILELRQQLQYVKKFLLICKDGTNFLSDIKNLPPYWSDDFHLYSLCDLVNAKNQQMFNQLKNIVTSSITHVENCQFCQGLGFICELCRNNADVIFPFQLNKVEICQGCKSCFHRDCFVPDKCPRCARLEARRQRMEQKFSEEMDEEDS
ncbi:run domain Beclin-1-interacting and cysteine-rich domain-containing protein-like isoform X1 [Mytilus edulis]|uniref:run domain Beclin-1-interacting and cysteine-rich domain-containing protein-like isoform X1 n=1 Tax=Mytilus edulis TaxID=6550 RepID=UPI0039F130AC